VIDVVVPDEQEGTKAVVRAWLKQIGDTVAVNDPLVELETDKVTQEVPAPAAGVLAEIMLDTDAEAVPGALLGRISQESNEAVRPDGEIQHPLGEGAISSIVEGRPAQSPEMRLRLR
jgi:2-oxoglutarate dehydrogenase E2 component (dihydrolipoamide succinyltransferase)